MGLILYTRIIWHNMNNNDDCPPEGRGSFMSDTIIEGGTSQRNVIKWYWLYDSRRLTPMVNAVIVDINNRKNDISNQQLNMFELLKISLVSNNMSEYDLCGWITLQCLQRSNENIYLPAMDRIVLTISKMDGRII